MLIFLINLISSTKYTFNSGTDESECFYNLLFKNGIYSNFICIIKCTFNSIKSDSNGGAIIIDTINRFSMQNYIDNCSFSECTSKSGGAIYININNSITTEIFNSEFRQNSAYQSDGGAICAFSKTKNNFIMQNCTFSSNSAIKLGGSIVISKFNFLFDECFFNDNKISDSSFNEGGAIFSTYSNASIIKCTFNKNSVNSTYSKGGAISMDFNSYLSLYECTFKNNKIIGKQNNSYGGAISLMNSIISCKKSSFINNIAYSDCTQSESRSGGGAIMFYYSMINNVNLSELFIDCFFTNNTAYSNYCLSYGGAIFFLKSHIFQKTISFTSNEVFKNLTFINNTAYSWRFSSYGGAIAYEASILYPYQKVIQNRLFEYLSFVNNTAFSESSSSQGGAICFLFFYSSYCIFKQNGTLTKSAFTNNTAISSDLSSFGGAISIYSSSNYISNAIEFFNHNIFNYNNALSDFSCGGSIYLFNAKGIFQNCTFNNNMAMESGGGVFLNSSDFSFIECIFQNNTGSGNSNISGGAIFSLDSILYLLKNSFIDNILSPKNVLNINCCIKGAACYFNNSEVRISDCDFKNNTIKIMHSNAFKICGGAIYSYTTTESFICTNCFFINNTVHVPNKKENEFGGAIYLTNGTLNSCAFICNMAYNGCDIKYDQIKNSKLSIIDCNFEQNKIENKNDIKSLIYINVIYNSSFINEFYNNRIINNIFSYLFDGKVELKSTIIKFNLKDNCLAPFNSNSFSDNQFVIYNENGEEISFNSAFNSVCSEYVVSKTMSVVIQTDQIQIQNMTTPVQTQTENLNSQIISSLTQTEQFIRQTPSNSLPSFVNQQNGSNNENKKNQKIFILLICIMTFQIIFVLLLIVWLVLKVNQKRNKNDFTDPLIDIE